MRLLKLTLAAAAALLCLSAFAQTEEPAPEGYRYVDTIIYNAVPRVNQELAGKTVYDVLPAQEVKLHQSQTLRSAVDRQIRSNRAETVEGYRIRIYFDNKQDSREASSESEQRFKKRFPGYSTYRTFSNPFFKVTVGDFRTKADAQVALQKISREFPSAFIVREQMKFPVISDGVRVTVDTLRMLVPIEQPKTDE